MIKFYIEITDRELIGKESQRICLLEENTLYLVYDIQTSDISKPFTETYFLINEKEYGFQWINMKYCKLSIS